ncbi:MAG: hypothetical protein WCY05_04985 [Candidatus Omnitrophota bacterium]
MNHLRTDSRLPIGRQGWLRMSRIKLDDYPPESVTIRDIRP